MPECFEVHGWERQEGDRKSDVTEILIKFFYLGNCSLPTCEVINTIPVHQVRQRGASV